MLLSAQSKQGNAGHVSTTINLAGVIFIIAFRYEIYSKVEDRAFVMSVDLKLCFKGDACEFQHTIMDNAVIPYPICRLDADFLDPGMGQQSLLTMFTAASFINNILHTNSK